MNTKGLGIMGGTFDPIHIGHLQIACAVSQRLGPEQVMFIPAYIPPHKLGMDFAPAEDRYAMTELAIASYEGFIVSDMEMKRSGVSYTIDTVRQQAKEHPEEQLYFIIGADSVAQLHTWHNIQELLELAIFVAAGRPGYDGVMEEAESHLGAIARKRIMLLDTPEYDVSSTEIRSRIKAGQPLTGLVTTEVEKYIYEHGLYGAESLSEDK